MYTLIGTNFYLADLQPRTTGQQALEELRALRDASRSVFVMLRLFPTGFIAAKCRRDADAILGTEAAPDRHIRGLGCAEPRGVLPTA